MIWHITVMIDSSRERNFTAVSFSANAQLVSRILFCCIRSISRAMPALICRALKRTTTLRKASSSICAKEASSSWRCWRIKALSLCPASPSGWGTGIGISGGGADDVDGSGPDAVDVDGWGLVEFACRPALSTRNSSSVLLGSLTWKSMLHTWADGLKLRVWKE